MKGKTYQILTTDAIRIAPYTEAKVTSTLGG